MSDWHRVLVTGSREWTDPDAVEHALDLRLVYHGRITVIHGNCPTGADLHAKAWAESHILAGMRQGQAWMRHERYPALWDEFDKVAGPIRNRYMVQLEADECIAFPTASSRGTISCMDLARAAGIPIENLGVKLS